MAKETYDMTKETYHLIACLLGRRERILGLYLIMAKETYYIAK